MGEVMRLNLDPPDYIGMSWYVIDGIIEGDSSIQDLCKAVGIPMVAFYRTTMKDNELKDGLKLARQIRAQRYADTAVELSRPTEEDWDVDNQGRYTANAGKINRDSLQIKTLLHLAAKMDPETFGDRIINDDRGGQRAVLVIGDTDRAAALIAKARAARLEEPKERDIGVDKTEAGPENAAHAAPGATDPAQGK